MFRNRVPKPPTMSTTLLGFTSGLSNSSISLKPTTLLSESTIGI